jgi:hypothetical protein
LSSTGHIDEPESDLPLNSIADVSTPADQSTVGNKSVLEKKP